MLGEVLVAEGNEGGFQFHEPLAICAVLMSQLPSAAA